ncbi:maleylpyruvate isomerase N-terminal domain-containing protein, partial [Mycolicibacter minnesotensis]
MCMIDMTSACRRTAQVVANVTDDQLTAPTPCEKLPVDDLVAHVGGLAL